MQASLLVTCELLPRPGRLANETHATANGTHTNSNANDTHTHKQCQWHTQSHTSSVSSNVHIYVHATAIWALGKIRLLSGRCRLVFYFITSPANYHTPSLENSFSVFLLIQIYPSCWQDLLNQVEQYLRSLHLPNLRSHCFRPSSDTSCYTLLLEQISTGCEGEGCYCYLLSAQTPSAIATF